MEALCNLDSTLYVDTKEVIKYTETEQHEWGEKKTDKTANLLPVLVHGKERLWWEPYVARTYLSTKKTKTVTSTVFADNFIKDFKELSDHTKRMISLLYRIKEIK